MKPYIIITPDFAHVCAGIKVLHRLCHLLNERGLTAYITGRRASPEFSGYTNVKTLDSLSPEEIRDIQYNGIAVYPDIITGNPLKITTVVKWWVGLVQPSPEHEIVFSYASNQNTNAQAPHNLFIMHIEDYFRYPDQENRDKTCFRVHKGAHLPRIPETNPPCIEIDSSLSRPAVAQLLQSSSIFYSYDDLSTLSIEARICGCPVKIIGYTCLTEKSLKESPYTLNGIAIPGEEVNLDKLRSELPLFQAAYDDMQRQSVKELDQFIDITQSAKKEYVVDTSIHPYIPWLPVNKFNFR